MDGTQSFDIDELYKKHAKKPNKEAQRKRTERKIKNIVDAEAQAIAEKWEAYIELYKTPKTEATGRIRKLTIEQFWRMEQEQQPISPKQIRGLLIIQEKKFRQKMKGWTEGKLRVKYAHSSNKYTPTVLTTTEQLKQFVGFAQFEAEQWGICAKANAKREHTQAYRNAHSATLRGLLLAGVSERHSYNITSTITAHHHNNDSDTTNSNTTTAYKPATITPQQIESIRQAEDKATEELLLSREVK